MRRIVAFAIGFLITFFILSIIAWHGAKIVRPAHADEIVQPQEAQPEAKPEFKLPWKTFSATAEALNGEPSLQVCRNGDSVEEYFKVILLHDGDRYGYAALNNRWAIWLYKGNEIVFMWLGHSSPGSDDIVPMWAMLAPEIKLIFPKICDWFIQKDA